MAGNHSIPWVKVRQSMKDRYDELEGIIREVVEKVANRILPIRKCQWKWEAHSAPIFREKGWHELVSREALGFYPKIKGQRGLSLSRIEQITNLRKCLLSYNRSCLEKFGEPPIRGEEMLSESTPEPCPAILSRLEKLKDQRIKQSAHLIIEKALGLRLIFQDSRSSVGDVHGAYERIPGRRPVDLIVLEDLGRYRASQGRGKRENSSLMQWCHRAILDKVKEMAEPFGITVLEVQPDYSSRFHSLTGNVGFRANRISARDADSDYARWICDEKERGKRTERDDFFRAIVLKHREAKEKGLCLEAMLIPEEGGTDFIGIKREDGKLEGMNPYQADLNAAVNLALAGIAAPRAFNIHRKVRLEKKGDEIQVVRTNKREVQAYPAKALVRGDDLQLKSKQNAFLDHGMVASKGQLESKDIEGRLVTSLGLFREVKKWRYELCRVLNNRFIKRKGLREIAQQALPSEADLTYLVEEEDDIPGL